jgi:hypothetical protein
VADDRGRLERAKRLARRAARALREHAVAAFAATVCLLFVMTLRDTPRGVVPPPTIPAPAVPASIVERDAALTVEVVNAAGQPVAGSSVRVFTLHEGKAYFAGDRAAGADGRAAFSGLPRGEAWVLAYGAGLSRASARFVLAPGPRSERLVLQTAKALDVEVVDPADKPVEGARVEVKTADPLPYVAMTDARGKARVDRLGPSPYAVRVSARAYDDALRTGVVAGPTPLRIRLERLGALEVTVVGPDGKPAAGATVLAAGSGLWPPRSTETNQDGAARIAGLRGGVYDLKARRGELVSRTEIGILVRRGDVKQARLELVPGKRVRIKVTDGDGDRAPGVKDASVALVEDGLSSFPVYGRTGKEGVAVLGPIARGPAAVSARAPGFVATSAVRVEPDAGEARVVLRRGGAIVGDVVDDRGYPVSGATIEVVGTDADGMPIAETNTMTEFRDDLFEHVLPGPAPLIPMGELGVMAGPIPDLPRGALPVTSGDRRGGEAWVTRRDGFFRAAPVPPGRVHVIVRHPSYVEATSETVAVTSGGESKVHVVLRQGGWIEGRVLEEDRTPVAGARIELSAMKGALERVAHAADDGTFTFVAAPDDVLLTVSRPTSPMDAAARVRVSVPDRDRVRVEIILPQVRESVKVRVRDDRGYPVDRVEVRALSLEPAVLLRRTVFTNGDGETEIPDALDLPLRVTFVRPSKSPKVLQLDSAPGQLDVVLERGIRARGQITGRGGRDRLQGAEVTIYTPAGARHVRTDRSGDFEVDDLAPGRARIVAHHKDYASAEETVTVADDRRHVVDLGTLDLAEAGEVEGEVVDDTDRPVAGARVALDGVPTYLPLGPLPRGIVATDRDGRFVLGGLPAGQVTLEAYTVDLGHGSVENVEVRAGRTTRRVKIALPGGTPTKEVKGGGSVAVTLGEGERGAVEVVLVPAGSEAEVAGLEPGDTILRVNGRDVRTIEEARKRLTGPLAEDVVITVRREGEANPWLVRVRRERVRR